MERDNDKGGRRMRELTNGQREAVRAYSEHFGPGWKARLAGDWMHGRQREHVGKDGDGHLLYSLRNSHGPKWLDGYKG